MAVNHAAMHSLYACNTLQISCLAGVGNVKMFMAQ